MNTAISWLLWKGASFRVPLSTLQRPKDYWGLALTHIISKCMTLFMMRMVRQGQRTDTFTADWLTKWRLHGRRPNPPHIKRFPKKFDYLYQYNIESAYAPMRASSEHPKSYKIRLYTALLTSIQAAAVFPELRVQKLWPDTDWERIWKNLNDAPVPENTRCIWYHVMHDIIPTNVRLHLISMVPSDTRRRCTATDTLEHRLLACGEGRTLWQYTKTLLARMLRTMPARIQDDWPLRPHFHIWPPRKHRAILWIIDNVVILRM